MVKYRLTAQLAREAGDTEAFIRSALGFDVAQFLAAKPLAEMIELLTEAMGKIEPGISGRGVSFLSRLARAHSLVGDSQNSTKCHNEGVNLARRLGDKNSLFELSVLSFLTPTTVKSIAESNSDGSHR